MIICYKKRGLSLIGVELADYVYTRCRSIPSGLSFSSPKILRNVDLALQYVSNSSQISVFPFVSRPQ